MQSPVDKPLNQRTALHDIQAEDGARMVDFHGWEMAVQFTGISAEHVAVRTACGVFDLGHMGRLRLSGAGALDFLSRQVCRPLADMKSGQVRYALALAEDGTVEDDVLVSREGPDSFHVVVNAGNHTKILALWRAAVPTDVRLDDLSSAQAMLAVQGPRAAELLAGIGLDGRALKNYAFADHSCSGAIVRLSRTGYTGEDGFECFLPTARAVDLWRTVRGAGATSCGLGCRDSLRLEAGMPLYGHELDRTVTPVQAGLAFALGRQGGYVGAEAVLAELAQGPRQRLIGLAMIDQRVPRQGYALFASATATGEIAVGRITSGTWSPTFDRAIGMAYVAATSATPGTRLGVDVRGTRCAAEVVALPFYRRKKTERI